MSNILTPISDNLNQGYVFADNEIPNFIHAVNFFKIFNKHSKIKKRHGYTIESIVYTLIIWSFLKQNSIKMFCNKCLSIFLWR